MTKKTKHVGRETGARSSDKLIAPQNPYTGDGRTKRSIFDGVVNVFRQSNGKKS